MAIKGALYILRLNHYRGQGRRIIAVERAPGGEIDGSGNRQAAFVLKRPHRGLQVGSEMSVDLAAGEVRPGEQNLRTDHGGTRRTLFHRLLIGIQNAGHIDGQGRLLLTRCRSALFLRVCLRNQQRRERNRHPPFGHHTLQGARIVPLASQPRAAW